MWIYIVILGIIWVGLLIPVVQERRAWIVFAHGGSGVFFTSILLSLGFHQTGDLADIAWLEVIGFFLFIPAAILMVFAMISLVKENITIGVFTDVYADEIIEWIPELYNIKINEWAVWTEDLSV